MEIELSDENHRHESGETTRRYVHAMDDDRHHDMQ